MRTLAVLVATALGGTVAGCAAVPTGGPPQKVTGGSGQPQAYALPMPPPPPQARWTADQVVLGFLHASASFAANWAAARQYLAQPLRNTWTPDAVTVVAPPSSGSFKTIVPHGAAEPGGPTPLVKVTFTGQRLATLTSSGQYLYEPGNPVYSFTLVKLRDVWLIDDVPKGVLLLTHDDFQDVYQPSNLYFFAPGSSSAPPGDLLVPDPVYAPIQGTTRTTSASNATLATSLVKGLLRGPGSWLSNNATWTAFPARTTLIGDQVRISGQTAIVNLGGGARGLKPQSTQLARMAAQLQYTLTTGAYSAPVAHSVALEIDGRSVYTGTAGQLNLIAPVASTPALEPVYFQSGPDSVSEVPSATSKPQPAAGPAQIGQSAITTVAGSPGSLSTGPRMLAIATRDGHGCAVFVGVSRSSAPYRSYSLSSTGGACTSLSWDRNGNIWAAAGQHLWFIRQHQAPAQVRLPAGPAAGQKGLQVLGVRIAPDGIRAALLVHTPGGGNSLLLAAVRYSGTVASLGPAVSVGTDLSQPGSMSWYDPYDLVVLASGAIYEVQLTGGSGQQRPLGAAPPGAQSITTNGTDLVFGTKGTSGNQVLRAPNMYSAWTTLAKQGSGPVYPG